MRFTIHLQPDELAALEVVNPLTPGGVMLIQAGTRVDTSGAVGDVIYGPTIVAVEQDVDGATVVTLELPGWELIPNLGGPVDPAMLDRLRAQDASTLPVTADAFYWTD